MLGVVDLGGDFFGAGDAKKPDRPSIIDTGLGRSRLELRVEGRASKDERGSTGRHRGFATGA